MEKREDHSPPRRCAVRFNQSKVSPCVRWRVHDRDGFIVLQLIARSTNVRQVLALRRLDQRLTSRIDASVDWHIGIIEPKRDQISAHDPIDDYARLHQIRQQRTYFTLEFLMIKPPVSLPILRESSTSRSFRAGRTARGHRSPKVHTAAARFRVSVRRRAARVARWTMSGSVPPPPRTVVRRAVWPHALRLSGWANLPELRVSVGALLCRSTAADRS